MALFKIPWVRQRWEEKFTPVTSEAIPWTPLTKPLARCTIALITTGGVHLKNDAPFNMDDKDGDPSYRTIPSTATKSDLMITHDYYDHTDADSDINLVLPIDILRACQEEGIVGRSSEFFYSLMGHIVLPHLPYLVEKTAKEIATALQGQGVDIVFLVPA